jgi:hypothetical protein
MLRALGDAVDRRIATSMVTRARRRWPLLQFVPAALIRPALVPTATVVRREISRTAIRTLVPIGLLTTLLIVLGAL